MALKIFDFSIYFFMYMIPMELQFLAIMLLSNSFSFKFHS